MSLLSISNSSAFTYELHNEFSTLPFFQITESDQLIPSPTRPRPSAFVPDDHGNYLLTAYFTKKPQDICKKRHRHSSKDDDTLVLQMSDVRWCKPQFMEIPLDEKKLGNTKWVKGRCFKGMGKMYLNYFIQE